MKIVIYLFFIISITFNANTKEIATLNILEILDKNIKYNRFLQEIELIKNEFSNVILQKEEKIKNLEIEIENNQLILNDQELNKKIYNLEKEYEDLEKYINKYNYYIEYNINFNKTLLLNAITECVKEISIQKNIDLVLNENNYFISNENLDITNETLIKLESRIIDFTILKEEKVFEN